MATLTTKSAVALRASVPASLLGMLDGPPVPGRVLARFRTALYVAVPRGFGAIAVLTRDAVRLPCGLQLPLSAAEFDLDGPVVVGGGALRVGDVEVRAGRVVSLRVSRRAAPFPELVRAARTVVAPADIGDVRALIGRGGGLTPSGDDVLAGYLVAAAAYGVPADPVRHVVRREAVRRTTTLSAALLLHAAQGETIPQVAALLDALAGARPLGIALADLLAVGHSSGEALASGVLAGTPE
jgi:hypothetical protein